MWHPDKAQWWVIWITVIAGFVLASGPIGPLAFAGAVFVGGLLVWQLEGKRRNPKPKTIFCGECGEQINPGWKHCPVCGIESWKAQK